MKARQFALAGALVYAHPDLVSVMQEHLDSYEELLPHVFMADVARWAVRRLERSGSADTALLSVLEYLENAYVSRGEDEQELIVVSFLENFPRPGEPGDGLRNLVGPTLQEAMARIG